MQKRRRRPRSRKACLQSWVRTQLVPRGKAPDAPGRALLANRGICNPLHPVPRSANCPDSVWHSQAVSISKTTLSAALRPVPGMTERLTNLGYLPVAEVQTKGPTNQVCGSLTWQLVYLTSRNSYKRGSYFRESKRGICQADSPGQL